MLRSFDFSIERKLPYITASAPICLPNWRIKFGSTRPDSIWKRTCEPSSSCPWFDAARRKRPDLSSAVRIESVMLDVSMCSLVRLFTLPVSSTTRLSSPLPE